MTAEVNAGYEPHLKQIEAHQSGARFLALAAGVRGGKTKGAAAEFLFRIARDWRTGKRVASSGIGRQRRPALHYWVVAPIAGLLKEPLRYLFECIPSSLIDVWYESDKSLWLKGDILIEFKTADNPLHLVASGLNGIWVDEAARLKPDAWRGQLRQRLTDKLGWAIFSTTPLGKNWFYSEIVAKDGLDPEYRAVTWTTADNPYIPAGEIEAARRQLPHRYFVREYLAGFDAFAGTIYDEWDEKIHVVTEKQIRLEYAWRDRPIRDLFRRCIGGVDWGWSSPGAIVVIGDTGRELLMVEESYAANRMVSDIRESTTTWVREATRLRGQWGVSQFHCDPSEPGFIFEFTKNGLPAAQADNDLIYGIRKTATALHGERMNPNSSDGPLIPRMRVFDWCTEFRREIKSYVFKQAKDGLNYTEYPEDGLSDHAMDASRYAVVEMTLHESKQRNNGGYSGRPIG